MPSSWCYNNNDNYCKKYGRLYSWEASLNACPEGWNLPLEKEYETLLNYFGNSELDRARALSLNGSSGFNDLLAGINKYNSYEDLGFRSCYWLNSASMLEYKPCLEIRKNLAEMSAGNILWGYSVRCIKKQDPQSHVLAVMEENNKKNSECRRR